MWGHHFLRLQPGWCQIYLFVFYRFRLHTRFFQDKKKKKKTTLLVFSRPRWVKHPPVRGSCLGQRLWKVQTLFIERFKKKEKLIQQTENSSEMYWGVNVFSEYIYSRTSSTVYRCFITLYCSFFLHIIFHTKHMTSLWIMMHCSEKKLFL